MVADYPLNSAGTDTRAGNLSFKENSTQSLHATVGRENTGFQANLANSNTSPSHATVASENSGVETDTQPYNASVGRETSTVKQAGLGFVICEYCGKEVQKKIYNQRFCCTDCRLTWHGFMKTTAKG